jgi:hypothetical protein
MQPRKKLRHNKTLQTPIHLAMLFPCTRRSSAVGIIILYLLLPVTLHLLSSLQLFNSSLLSKLLLLDRRVQLALASSASRPSPRPLRLLCHLRLSAQLLVGVDYVCLLGRHFLALDDSEAGSRWRVGSGGGGGCGCSCGGSAGHTRSYRDSVVSWLEAVLRCGNQSICGTHSTGMFVFVVCRRESRRVGWKFEVLRFQGLDLTEL